MEEINDKLSRVMRGTINGKATYARIPIVNKYPCPNKDDDPINALIKLVRYSWLMAQYEETKDESLHALSEAKKIADVFKDVEVVYQK